MSLFLFISFCKIFILLTPSLILLFKSCILLFLISNSFSIWFLWLFPNSKSWSCSWHILFKVWLSLIKWHIFVLWLLFILVKPFIICFKFVLSSSLLFIWFSKSLILAFKSYISESFNWIWLSKAVFWVKIFLFLQNFSLVLFWSFSFSHWNSFIRLLKSSSLFFFWHSKWYLQSFKAANSHCNCLYLSLSIS